MDPDEQRSALFRLALIIAAAVIAAAATGVTKTVAVIAAVLLFVTFTTIGIEGRNPELKVGELTLFKNGQSPAQQAGFKLGDRIVSVDGHRFARWDDLPTYIQAHPEQTLTFVVLRDGKQITLEPRTIDRNSVVLKGNDQFAKEAQPVGFVGIGPAYPIEKTGVIPGIGKAGQEFGSEAVDTLKALGRLVTFKGIKGYGSQLTGHNQGTPTADQPRFLSPVGLVQVAG